MKIDISDRLKKLPPYLFVEIDKAKKKARDSGADVIDLGVGDPDMPTPKFIIDALNKASLDPATHKYALDKGLPGLRIEIAKWYKKRFNVSLDPDTEVLPLLGSKEGIAHIPLAFINTNDVVLVPDPCYPPYKSGTIFAGGEPVVMPLRKENAFLPDLKALKRNEVKRSKMMFLNYPNNPTSSIATKGFFLEAVRFAAKENIIICHDAAYSEMAFEGYRPPSFLEVDGAKEAGIEFHSLSKTFNMTGWRVGFACGSADVIKALSKVKSNIDSGIFTAVQHAAIQALKGIDRMARTMKVYQSRRDVFVDGLNKIGWSVDKPKATFYVWAPVIKRHTSITLAKLLLDEASCVVTPGNGFGPSGEGYIRVALTRDESLLREAVKRISKIL